MSTTTTKEFFSPPEIARLLDVTHYKVIQWIAAGELIGVDLSQTRNQRPRWRVSRAALDAFLDRRSSSPTPRVGRKRRKRRKADGVHEFYPEK